MRPAASSASQTFTFRTRVVEDVDAMGRDLTGGHVDFVPLRPGQFSGRFCEINAGGMMIRRVVHDPMLMHGMIRAGYASIQLTLRRAELRLNGRPFDRSQVALIAGGKELSALCAMPQDRLGIVIPDAMLAQALDDAGTSVAPVASFAVLPLADPFRTHLTATLADVTDFVERFPSLASTAGVGPSIADECRRLLAATLTSTRQMDAPSRANRDAIARVRMADEFLRANITRPVYGEEICTAVGVAARTLHQSFMAVYGMPTATYLRRRRLMLVRRALLAARHQAVLVKSIALDHGFWHLGRFARDYAMMFGETPSATLERRR